MNHVEINCDTIAYWQKFCNQSLDLLSRYKIFIDSYVLEFFSEDLWNKVPKKWQAALSQLSPQQLAAVLQPPGSIPQEEQLLASVLPLSFLAFRAAAFSCSLPRTAVSSVQPFLQYLKHCEEAQSTCPDGQTFSSDSSEVSNTSCSAAGSRAPEDGSSLPPADGGQAAVLRCLRPAWPSDQPDQALWQAPLQELCKASGHHTLLSHVFRRHLKPKKQHEVARHALVAALAARATRSLVTADIGGGCGHLSRLMAYGYNMEVVCVDREQEFVRGARKFDAQLEQSVQKLQKRLPPGQSLRLPAGPRHAACLLRPGLQPHQFVQTVVTPHQSSKRSFTDALTSQDVVTSCCDVSGECGKKLTKFGLTGLHTCGDLAPLMLRLFLNSPQCCYVASVACCYMKLTVASDREEDSCIGLLGVATNTSLQDDGVADASAINHNQYDVQCEVNGSPENSPLDSLMKSVKNVDEIRTKVEKLDGGIVPESAKEKNDFWTSKVEHLDQTGTGNMKESVRNSSRLNEVLHNGFKVKKLESQNENTQQYSTVSVQEDQANHIKVDYTEDKENVGETPLHEKQNNKAIKESDSSAVGGENDAQGDGSAAVPGYPMNNSAVAEDDARGDGSGAEEMPGSPMKNSAVAEDDARGDGSGAEEMPGYPMSRHCIHHPSHELSYAARELACHALEAYAERLTQGADNLKVHCYRAALEQVLVRHYPQHRRAGLRPVKLAHTRPFHEYVRSAVSALDGGQIVLPEEELQSLETEEMLARWHQVIVFHSLRLLLAPVIETVLLLDRCFFLYENGVDSVLVPAFDPKLSPRNMILLAAKKPR